MTMTPPPKPRCPTCGGVADRPGTLGCNGCRQDAALADRADLTDSLAYAWTIVVFIVLLPVFAAWLLYWHVREALTTDWPHAGCDDWEVW
jgi:hypothetical protein